MSNIPRFDPESFANGAYLAGHHIQAGATTFPELAAAMIADLGESVRPYLLSFYEAVRHYPGLNSEGMTDTDEASSYFASMMLMPPQTFAPEGPQDGLLPGDDGTCVFDQSGAAVARSTPTQLDLGFTRQLLDQLLADSRLYSNSSDYKDLLRFVARLRNFAPYNGMLLHLQRPGLAYAASEKDWRERFHRKPKEGARPLLILWPFAPMATVYDVMDTDGAPIPVDAFNFVATGPMDATRLAKFEQRLAKKHIHCEWVDTGDQKAGSIRVVTRSTNKGHPTKYQIKINRNHKPAVQFVTLSHELAHLLLGHLGPDAHLEIPDRRGVPGGDREVEAESIAFVMSEKIGVTSRSHPYLSGKLRPDFSTDDLNINQIMHAAGRVERLLGIATNVRYDKAGP